jgi:hypothetical protein
MALVSSAACRCWKLAAICLSAVASARAAWHAREVAGLMLGLDTRSGGLMGTSDFPYILANVANKTLRAAYEAAPQTFKPFCRQTTNPDFKTIARTQLGDAPSLDVVAEGGEFKRGSTSDQREQYALATYGKVVAISRQVIINDDLSAFTPLA